MVEQAMPTLIELMYDSSVAVRDTAAWAFGRICEIVPEAATNETYIKPLLESLLNGLKVKILNYLNNIALMNCVPLFPF